MQILLLLHVSFLIYINKALNNFSVGSYGDYPVELRRRITGTGNYGDSLLNSPSLPEYTRWIYLRIK